MLRITAVSAGAVDYLLRGSDCAEHRHAPQRTAEPEMDGPGYFLSASEHGEAPGVWGGKGLSMLGIDRGSLATEDDVRAVFGELKQPETGEYLGRAPRAYKSYEKLYAEAAEREPDATEERLREIKQECLGGQRKSVAYYDLTFSPAKSVSVYYAALIAEGRSEDAQRVLAAHERAVDTAMGYAEKHAAYTRTGYHGKALDGRSVGRYEDAEGFAWTTWRHSTNRAQEPQLHSHVAVLNRVATTSDGQIRALDGKGFQPIKEAIDTFYTDALEETLEHDLGVVFAARPDGKAREILGIDPELCADASSRRATIEARVAERVAEFVDQYGHEPTPQQLKQITQTETLDSRAAKPEMSPQEQFGTWNSNRLDRLAASLDDAEIARTTTQINGHPDAQLGAHTTIEEALHAAVEAVQEQYSTWNVGNLTAAIRAEIKKSPGLAGDYEELASRVLRVGNDYGVLMVTAPDPATAPEAVQRSDGRSVYRPHIDERYATGAHLATEDRVTIGARQLTAPRVAGTDLELLRVELEANGLKPDQVAAVIGTVSSGRAADVLIGPAGAGKSRTVGTLAETWRNQFGGRVLGLATSQRATQELEGHGLEAVNTTRFLAQFSPDPQTGELREGVRPGDLFVVDESGMSSTGELARISKLVEDGGGKLVYTGDPEQLDAVGAGGLFELIARDNGAHQLQNVMRFRADWERDASLRLRGGDKAVLREYEDRGRLRGGTREQVQDAAIRGYLADILEGRESLLIVGSNAEAADLSARIQAQLVELGRVQPEVLATDREGNSLGAGDVIQARRNAHLDVDDGSMVVNRLTYEVLGWDDRDRLMARGRDTGAVAHLPESYVSEHVTLGYASTDYAAQGRTVDTGHALIDEATTRNAAYTRLTRGIDCNTAYVETEREPDAHTTERLARTPAEVMAEALDRDGTQRAALLELRQGVESAAGIGTVGTQWDLVSKEYARDRYTDVLAELIPAEQMDTLVAEHGYERLLRAVREAELSGHNADALIREAVEQRSLTGADSSSDVLRARLRHQAEQRQPEQQVDPTNWTTLQAPIQGTIGQYAHELAVLASDRQQVLGRQAAEELPEWALANLGPVPDDEGQRDEWIRRAGIAAAYRELHSVPETSVSLGAAPSREQEFHRALWQQAYAALGRPTEALDYAAATEHELRETRQRWLREQAWAPAYVAEELAQAHTLAADYRADAAYARAQLEQMSPESEVYVESARQSELSERLGEQYRERAEQLEEIHLARANWFEATEDARLAADMATGELQRRGHELQPERTEPQQLELFDLAQKTEVQPGPTPVETSAEPQQDAATEPATRPGQPREKRADVEAEATPAQAATAEPERADDAAERVQRWQQWAAERGTEREQNQAERGTHAESDTTVEPDITPETTGGARPSGQSSQQNPAADRVEPGREQLTLVEPKPTLAEAVQAQPIRQQQTTETEPESEVGETLAEARRQARVAEQQRLQREAADRERAEQHAQRQAEAMAEAKRQRREHDRERHAQAERERAQQQQRERHDEPEIELVRTSPEPQPNSPQRRHPVDLARDAYPRPVNEELNNRERPADGPRYRGGTSPRRDHGHEPGD